MAARTFSVMVTCCSTTNLAERCWQLVTVAIRVFPSTVIRCLGRTDVIVGRFGEYSVLKWKGNNLHFVGHLKYWVSRLPTRQTACVHWDHTFFHFIINSLHCFVFCTCVLEHIISTIFFSFYNYISSFSRLWSTYLTDPAKGHVLFVLSVIADSFI